VKKEIEEALTKIDGALARAKVEKPAYGELYPFLEALFKIQTRAKGSLNLLAIELPSELVQDKWAEEHPLLRRWDFPLDSRAAKAILNYVEEHLPGSNQELLKAYAALKQALDTHAAQEAAVWRSFLQHDWEPWEEWVKTEGIDMPSLFFLARSCLRPSLEWVAEDLLRRFVLPDTWLKGFCPVCGSLPSLLLLEGEGERKAYCSWCGSKWKLHRLQCPYCDNRYHESLGYLYAESEPQYRAHYCRLCKNYFKQIDIREQLDSPYLPLEEWTTLHLDLLAQQAGWKQPPSPSPAVYADSAP